MYLRYPGVLLVGEDGSQSCCHQQQAKLNRDVPTNFATSKLTRHESIFDTVLQLGLCIELIQSKC